MVIRVAYAVVLSGGVSQPAAVSAANIETVLIGFPGNTADVAYTSAGRFGKVDYTYRMGKYEVTNAQYAEFLNAVAADDFNGLYNPQMETSGQGGIIRLGDPGGFSYTLKANMGDRPVGHVNLWDAARFANWLHNGQPTGGQTSDTTEDGAYTLNGDFPTSTPTWNRNAGATWFLPNENEWYKAAYYDPRSAAEGGPPRDDHYWLYPTKSDVAPTKSESLDAQGNITNPGPNVANYAGTLNVSVVGSAGPESASYFGTYDQGGNAFERTDTRMPVADFVVRGGAQNFPAVNLAASGRGASIADVDLGGFGFRVASIATDVPGDDANFDGNGIVDGSDFLIWQRTVGIANGAGDANSDGTVDQTDLDIWKTQFGTAGQGAVASVPEPHSTILLGGAVAVFGFRAHRRLLESTRRSQA